MDTAARRKREQTYPELLAAGRCRLVVLAFEVGGRWSDESLDFVRRLARAKARSQPEWRFLLFTCHPLSLGLPWLARAKP